MRAQLTKTVLTPVAVLLLAGIFSSVTFAQTPVLNTAPQQTIHVFLPAAGPSGSAASPTITKAFLPSSIVAGGSSTVTLTLTNPNATILTGGAFTDTLMNMSAVGGAVGGSCVGTTPNTLVAGATALSFTGITIPASGNCTVTFSVTSITLGANPNGTSGVTTTQTPMAGATSNTAPLTVVAVGVPAFAITKTHVGNFTQGQVGAMYTITVTNTGSAATTGATTVVDLLPLLLTFVSGTGGGFTCSPPAPGGPPPQLVPCTNPAGIASGTMSVITLTVNVASNAPAILTNTAFVMNPGVMFDSDDTVNDPTVIAAAVPDLTITKTHTGSFAPGQIGATYTITVTNSGTGPTVGTVMVVDTLPAGLTATAMVGPGWICNLGTLTCMTSAVVGPGGSFPPITLTVNVASNAPATVTNSVTVSGGGETNTANDTATDPTLIVTASAFQVRYASNLNIGDSVVNVTNNGAGVAATGGLGFQGGNICINTYVFDQSEEMLACCACFVTPNGLASFSVKSQLISNSLTPEIPNSIVIKLVATVGPIATSGAAGGVNGCNAGGVTFANLASGMVAFGTTLHALPTAPVTYGVTETPFSVSALSQAELNHLTSFCSFIQSNASGFGICKGCSIGGLGAPTQQ